ncbi:MAG TPA: NAD(P)-dependent alcohol dehydrogenase [Steroidobacteraceae bacterium]|nr:NAD(P)-dependent alcohol dehydrogenase [Steroidobacteraceae bacterium]
MKAIVFTRYGSPDVLELKDVDRPTPKDDEVLIRVHAASLNDWDCGALDGTSLVNRLIFGLLKPRIQILGSDIAGRVEAVGKDIRKFRPGDEVFGDLSGRWGGFAEYVCTREKALELKAPSMTFEEAAAIPQAGILALQGLRAMGGIKPGQRLLINAAGGGVGTFAIQIAKLEGAEVTAVDSPEKLDLLRSLGATHVIDYTQEDFTKNGRRYDLILDVKTTRSVFDYARALNRNGKYVTVGGSMGRLFQILLLGPWISMTQSKTLRVLSLKPNQGLSHFNELFEAGRVAAVIDGPYTLSEIPKAFRRFGKGLHKGKVVIAVKQSNGSYQSGKSP